MLDFKDISIEDKEKFDIYYNNRLSRASENSFTTLFIWNSYYNMQVAYKDDFMFIKFNIKNKAPQYAFPLGKGDIKKAMAELFEYSKSINDKLCLRFITEETKKILEDLYPDTFSFENNIDMDDYVYEAEKLILLSGKKLHGKRNHINFFIENYDYVYEKVENQEQINECKQFVYNQVEQKEKNLNRFELPAMKAYFDNYDFESQRGAMIRVNGEIVATSFGEKIYDDTALIQIEIAREDIRGAYPFINQMFCKNEWSDCKYINREEDMGIEGLRKAKKSYHPIFMVKKYFALEK